MKSIISLNDRCNLEFVFRDNKLISMNIIHNNQYIYVKKSNIKKSIELLFKYEDIFRHFISISTLQIIDTISKDYEIQKIEGSSDYINFNNMSLCIPNISTSEYNDIFANAIINVTGCDWLKEAYANIMKELKLTSVRVSWPYYIIVIEKYHEIKINEEYISYYPRSLFKYIPYMPEIVKNCIKYTINYHKLYITNYPDEYSNCSYIIESMRSDNYAKIYFDKTYEFRFEFYISDLLKFIDFEQLKKFMDYRDTVFLAGSSEEEPHVIV